MIRLPESVVILYVAALKKDGIPAARCPDYIKWLRYFLDFCDKYAVDAGNPERLRLFIEKLREKNQSLENRRQAVHAISLYLGMETREAPTQAPIAIPLLPHHRVAEESMPPRYIVDSRVSHYREAGYEEKSDSPEWDELLAVLAAEIKLRHYSRKTLKTYALWARQFQRFHKSKSPRELSTEDVKGFLTHLAVTCHVAASTQNQAFNSLLFLYRHALKREFGELRGVPRAKKSLYVPTVLSRPEIDA